MIMIKWFTPCSWPRRGVLLGILGGGVVPGSPNPDVIADQKNVIFHTRFQTRSLKSIRTWPNLACSKLSDSWGDSPSPVFSRIIFVFSLSQFSGPNYPIITKLERKEKTLQMHFKFAHFYFVLIHLELKRWIRPFMYAPVVPSKTIPDSTPKWAKCFQTKKAQNSYPSII